MSGSILSGQHSIRGKLTRMLVLTAVLSTSIGILGFGLSDWLHLKSAGYEQLESRASIVANNTVASLVFDDRTSALGILRSLKNERDIVAAGLYNRSGALYADFQNRPYTLPDTPPSLGKGMIGDTIYVSRPVTVETEAVGTVLIVGEFNYWEKRRLALFMTGAGLASLTLLVIAVFSRRLNRLVADPVIKLAETAREVTLREDYSLRAEKLSSDEIGWLVDDFNEMLNQIQFRDHILQRTREKLEEKVAERTQELTELTRQLEHQAYHDALTGLANRVTFDDHLKLSLSQAERYGGEVSVMFLDLDRFKVINDTLGHVVGDKLLIKVAQRFSSILRDTDTLARLGGDEFAVLITHPPGSNNAGDIAHKLIDAINEPFSIDGYNLHVTVSIGISVYPTDGDSVEEILKNADTAMYRSKEHGKNQFSFFALEMNARAMRRLEVENRLRHAVRHRKLEVYYQPRRDTKTLEIIGVEALVRWHDSILGDVNPAEFIPIAEECGLSAQIDDWVLRTACGEVRSWFEPRPPVIELSVNFSATQFIRKDLAGVVENVLVETGFPGDKLELEITENLFGPDTSNVLGILNSLRTLNVEFSIDDFGKAYSSLTRLKQLPLHTLKIDQAFIEDLPEKPDDKVLVRTIISMGKSLGLKVVAEGIENRFQYDYVKRYGCDAVQGYLFGKPLPGPKLKALLEEELALTSL